MRAHSIYYPIARARARARWKKREIKERNNRRILAVSESTKVARYPSALGDHIGASDKNRVSLKKGSINRSSRNKTQ